MCHKIKAMLFKEFRKMNKTTATVTLSMLFITIAVMANTWKEVSVLGMKNFSTQSEVKPVWQSGKNTIDPGFIKGKIEVTNGIFKLDGTNSFSLPSSLLGNQSEYTIEFDIKRANGTTRPEDSMFLLSNVDDEGKSGIGIKYFSPLYNAAWVYTNGYKTSEQRGFLDSMFIKYTVLVKDRNLMLFKNGLLLALTDKVKPSNKSLTIGEAGKVSVTPYEMRNFKIYDSAQFPTGFDPGVERMRTFSGDQYSMQRVDLKNKQLPRILVVGNSISMGYRNYITEYFKGKAYVDYWVGGGWIDPNSVKGENSPVKRAWSGVLNNGPYDVVSWNAMTLHMWWPIERCPEETLAPNMTEVVHFLKKIAPKTKFIWVRGTPARENQVDGTPTFDNPRNKIIVKYNKIVDRVMKEVGFPEVDLYGIAEKQLHTVRKGSNDLVHWSSDVYQLMANEIIKEIEKNIRYQAAKSMDH